MKTKTTLFAGLMILFSAAFVKAQDFKEPVIRILPTDQTGVIKIVYTGEAAESVVVNFFTNEGLLTTDKISKENIKGGFIKRYDVSNINSRNFWIEIATGDQLVKYKMTAVRGGNAYLSLLEKTNEANRLVASK